MKLTREQAIAEHRKMWRWIAGEIAKKKKYLNVSDLKYQYLSMLKIFPKEMCFFCQYTVEISKDFDCRNCPVEKPDGIGCLGGLYYKVCHAGNWQEQAALARQIAELPEREDV